VTFVGAVLASSSSNSSTLSDVEPGLLGFLVVAALAVVLVFLLRSMNKQFKKIGPAPGPESADADEVAEGTVGPPEGVPVVEGAVIADADADVVRGIGPRRGPGSRS
jgi:hypothetical protein